MNLASLFRNKTTGQIFLKNTFWLASGELLCKSFKFFLIPLSAKILGPEEFGIFSYISILTTTLFFLSDFGINALFIREYKKNTPPTSDLISSLWIIKGISLTVLSLIGASMVWWIQDPRAHSIFWVLLIFAILDQIKKTIFTLFEVAYKMELRTLGLITESAVTTLIGVWILTTTPSLQGLAIAYTIGVLTSTLLLLVLVRKVHTFTWIYNPKLIKTLTLLGIPFFFTFFLQTIMTNTDIFLIKWHIGNAAVGQFQTAAKLIQLGTIIPYIINTAMYPLLSHHHNDTPKLAKMIQKGLQLFMLIALPLFVFGQVLGPQLFALLFGPKYAPGIPVFQLLLVSLFIDFFLYFLNMNLLVLNQQKTNLKITGTALLLNAILATCLIPIIGIAGAAIATIIAKSTDITLTWRLLKKTLPKQTLRPTGLGRYILYTAIAIGTAKALLFIGIPFALCLIIGALLYPALLWLKKDPLLHLTL